MSLVGPGRSSRRCFPSILSPPGDPARRDHSAGCGGGSRLRPAALRVLVAAGDSTLPPDLKPMLEHAAIVAEMMHACRHTRSDLAARLSEAWSAWWTRNGRVQQALAALTNDAAGVRSEDGAPEISRSLVSPAEAGEILAAYKRLRQLLRRQVAEQAQLGNMISSAIAMMFSRN